MPDFSNMPGLSEKMEPLQVVGVRKIHDECGRELVFINQTIIASSAEAALYVHACPACNKEFHLETTYPTVKYAPILGANSNSNIDRPIAPG